MKVIIIMMIIIILMIIIIIVIDVMVYRHSEDKDSSHQKPDWNVNEL